MNQLANRKKPFPVTNSAKKVSNYLQDVLIRQDVKEVIWKLRRKYGIPSNGFPLRADGGMGIPPLDWERSLRKGQYTRFENELAELRKKYQLGREAWPDPLELYVLYGILDQVLADYMLNLCIVRDLHELEASKEWQQQEGEEIRRYFPIAISISPYASRRDIQDFIGKVYTKYIKPLQLNYRNPDINLGKTRKKSPQVRKRDEFIWRNRHMFIQELQNLVNKTFDTHLGYSEIAAIISHQNKLRGVR